MRFAVMNTDVWLSHHLLLDICPLVAEVDTGLRFVGSAFRVEDTQWFLTAAHVLDQAKSMGSVRLLWLQRIALDETNFIHLPQLPAPDKIERFASASDIALFRVPEAGRPEVPLALDAARVHLGLDAWTYGYPHTHQERPPPGSETWKLEFQPRLLRGHVTRTFANPRRNYESALELSFPVPPGLSGAPVMSASGRVIGVALGTAWTEYGDGKYGYGDAAPIVGVRDQISAISTADRAPPNTQYTITREL